MEIARGVAERLRDVIDAGLGAGLGMPVPGQMCLEAATCHVLELPRGADSGCVAPPLRRLSLRLAEARWSSNAARGRGLRRMALAQLGSAGVLDQRVFERRVLEMTIRTAVPAGLRAAALVNPEYARQLENAAARCEREGSPASCAFARETARAASDAYAKYADGTTYAAFAAATAAAAAVYPTTVAAAAAYAADAEAYAAAADGVRDRSLAGYAECVVEILVSMDAPGTQWLELAPLEAVRRDAPEGAAGGRVRVLAAAGVSGRGGREMDAA